MAESVDSSVKPIVASPSGNAMVYLLFLLFVLLYFLHRLIVSSGAYGDGRRHGGTTRGPGESPGTRESQP